MFRYVNIDWLEVYAFEDKSQYPLNADYFREHGWSVEEREYGTRMYREMFTLLDVHDEPLLEIRRNPFSTIGKDGGFFPPESCHIRLHNRTCYLPNPVGILRDFMARYGYILGKIYRIDICMDFERFDKGDDPQAFIERYMNGRYAKVNQARISAHGEDTWNGRQWNSLSWGQPKSMISTKMYCKTLELEQSHDKPYIWFAWLGDAEHRGLIDDPINHTRRAKDGTIYKPAIWRVEFSIKSSARRVFTIDRATGKRGRIVMPHTLEMYDNRLKLLTMFSSLSQHYFHFKHYEPNQRKDRCQDKVLFVFSPNDTFYKIDRMASHKSNANPLLRLLAIIKNYRETHFDKDVRSACSVLIDTLEQEITRGMMTNQATPKDVLFLRRLIAERINNPDKPLTKQANEIETLINLFADDVF